MLQSCSCQRHLVVVVFFCQSGELNVPVYSQYLDRPPDNCLDHPDLFHYQPDCRSTSGEPGPTGAIVRGCVEVACPSELDDVSYQELAGISITYCSVQCTPSLTFVQ